MDGVPLLGSPPKAVTLVPSVGRCPLIFSKRTPERRTEASVTVWADVNLRVRNTM